MANFKMWTLSFILLVNFLMVADSAVCCVSYTKHPRRCAFLKGYDIQDITGSCDLPAIVFHTVKGRTICADPGESWTKDRVRCLRIKAEQLKNDMAKTKSLF